MAGEINWGILDTQIPAKVANSFYEGQQQAQQNALLAAQLQHANSQNELSKYGLAKAQREDADALEVRNALMGARGDYAAAQNALMARGLYKPAMEIGKAQLEADEKRSIIGKNNAATAETNTKTLNLKLQQNKDLLTTINDPQTAAQWVTASWNDPDLGPLARRSGLTLEQAIARIPSDPAAFQQWKMQSGMGMDKLIQYTTPDANARLQANTSRANNAATNAVTVRGQNLADTRARETLNQGKVPSGYRQTQDGNLQAIPGGPADQKAQALEQQKAIGASDVDSAIATLRDAYGRLEKGGGITSTRKSGAANMAAAASSSSLGQAVGKALGTDNQSARNDIAMTRPALLAALMKATGMSAKQMDSNAELKLWLATATDPTLDVEANRRALDAIERKYVNRGVTQQAPARQQQPTGKPTVSNW